MHFSSFTSDRRTLSVTIENGLEVRGDILVSIIFRKYNISDVTLKI